LSQSPISTSVIDSPTSGTLTSIVIAGLLVDQLAFASIPALLFGAESSRE
jgi:hypothetical protein